MPKRINDQYDISIAFAAIEDELIASMIRNMRRHKVEEVNDQKQWTMWQVEQLKSLEKYRTSNEKKFGNDFVEINRKITELIRLAKIEGGMDQEKVILQAIKKGFKIRGRNKSVTAGTTAEFFKLNERKLEALIKATVDDMQKAEVAVLRMANDQYRKVIYNAQVYANTGAGTYEKAVDMATKDFLSSGLNCIEYANGARHTLSDYADMSIRTACKRAYLQGEGTMRQEWGIPTVIMNKRGNPCPLCLPFVGKVLIDDVWSGGSSDGISPITGIKYKLMSEAIAAGLYHPRCKDSHTTYFEGISTTKDGSYSKKEMEKIRDDYKNEQKEQYRNRQKEKYRRLAKYSLDEENQKRYAERREEWKRKVESDQKIIEEAGRLTSVEKNIAKASGSGIIKSGARITDLFSEEAENFAKMYYQEVKSFSTDVRRIAENIGKTEEDIRRIKTYLFESGFDPDCAIAQSWQRLISGKDIKKHDRTLVEHELFELRVKKDNPEMEHWKAHEIASKKYNYQKEAEEYYGNLEKHKKDRT